MSVESVVKELQKLLPESKIYNDKTYFDLTTLGVGIGDIPLFVQVENETELSKLLQYIQNNNLAYFVIGGGSNLLGTDDTFTGIIIRLGQNGFGNVEINGTEVKAGAAVKLPGLCRQLAENGLGGISPLCGIPGSLGGAIRMNAACHNCEISTCVRHLRGIQSDGTPWESAVEDIQWSYRYSDLPQGVIVTEVTLEMQSSSVETEQKIIADELESRKQREPQGRSAGCAFRNISDLDPAGKLIDQCGLKGLTLGEMKISEKHANYFINTGHATEKDFLELAEIARRAVAEKYGYYMKLEIHSVNPRINALMENSPLPPSVNVVYGGVSSEKEVSVRSGQAVAKALTDAGFKVVESQITECAVTQTMRECDVVYPVLHGGFGEDGSLQKLFEKESIKFVGSGSEACWLTMNKLSTKQLLDRLHLPTAKWCRVTEKDLDTPPELNFPVIIKAPCEGSSVGIVKVEKPEDWKQALAAELKFAQELLVEEFIQGIELTVPVINGVPAEAIEIRSPSGFYDYDAKYIYKNGHTEYFCPPVSLSPETIQKAKNLALTFYLAAGCRDILRVDFIADGSGTPIILEGNAIPGCTATSLVPKAARQAGLSFAAFASRQCLAALCRPVVRCSASVAQEGQDKNRQRQSNTANPALLNVTIWLFRIILLLCALGLFQTIMEYSKNGQSFTLPAITIIVLLATEPIYCFFNYLRKK